ncbi:MAG: right-handed parallel beta-helix repeat-containing protein, partial [Planctomycetes bacterium]|nr:right-handed parallel beta-helix repeat-containing protein [Planctomycetota bacterium]
MNQRATQRLVRLVLVLALLGLPALAQIPLSGFVSDGAGGPLLGGNVYTVATTVTVPFGQTLTVQPGAIVKFANASDFIVQGNLVIAASSGTPAIFTDNRDDSAGGDTNGDGPSSGSAGWWRGLDLSAGSASITGLECRFTGQSGRASIQLPTAPGTTVTDSVFKNYGASAIDYLTSGAGTISGCSFLNGFQPVVNCRLDNLETFTGNVASGNAFYDSVLLRASTSTGNRTIPAASVMGGAHVIDGNVGVGLGATLTIEAGVVFKLRNFAFQFAVDGTLICNGTAGNPVAFTELRDDTIGGDTNKDGGASVPAPSYWRGLFFGSTAAASQINGTIFRYAGQSGFAAIEINGNAGITVDGCSFANCNAAGIDLNGGLGTPIITNCAFDAVSIPITGVHLGALANFSGNTAVNCGTYNVILATVTATTTSVSFGGDNLINGTLALNSSVSIGSSATMTVDQGAIFKMVPYAGVFDVFGTLICDGSAGEIVFTEIHDDAHGGDSNADGPSAGVPGQWRGLQFFAAADASNLDQIRVRYSGQSAYPGIRLVDADLVLANSVIEDCSADGLSLDNSAALPTVTGCKFDRCRNPVVGLRLHQLPGLTANTASGNSQRDTIQVTSSILTSPVVIGDQNQINGALVMLNNSSVQVGASLTLQSKVVLKFDDYAAQFIIDGSLICTGTLANPVVFTTGADDQWAGDSNGDGPSTGTPGAWRGLTFTASSSGSILERAVVRFGGQSGIGNLEIQGSNLTMIQCASTESSSAGLDFNGTAAQPLIRDCRFDANAYAIRGARWDNLANLADNEASGNTVRDAVLVESGVIDGDVRVQAHALTGGCAVVSTAPIIGAGESLSFERGVVVKASGVFQFASGLGRLEVLGTGADPVVFTYLTDDDWAGDTDKNGPSSPNPGSTRGLAFTGSTLERCQHAIVRYPGQAGFAGIVMNNAQARLEASRVEYGNADGFDLVRCGGELENLVALSCAGRGLDLSGWLGGGDIRFATVTGCGTGIYFPTMTTSTIESTISWGNTTNFVNVGVGQLHDSNGLAALAGMDGNIDLDPLFVDAVNGDLNLQPSSPCMDAGDFALGLSVAGDFIDSSRVNDHDLDGNVGADMGAYEFCNWTMTVSGEPRLGQTLSFTLNGMPAFGIIS